MKKFFKLIDWKKFFRYELYSFLIIGVLYLASLTRGDNIFPENLYVVFLIPGLFGVMMILKTHSVTLEQKFRKNEKEA